MEFWLQDELAAHAAPQLERLETLIGTALDAPSRYVFALSEFALQAAITEHAWWRAAHAAQRFDAPLTAPVVRGMADEALREAPDMPALQAGLRRVRNRCQLWIV